MTTAQQARRVQPALALLLTALTALVPLLGNAPASAARAAARPAAAAPSYASTAAGASTSAGSEHRRTALPANRAMSTGMTRRLDSSQRAVDHDGQLRRVVDTRRPGHPATGGADSAGPPSHEWPHACGRPDSAHHRLLPVGAGRSPPHTCGS